MRLICPNCDAQYEVDEKVIPQGGRDVQCSNCGHTWFQNDPHSEALEAAGEIPADVPAEAPADAVPAADTAPAPEPEAAAEVAPERAPEVDQTDPGDMPAAAPQRRGLDPEVADVLREEAAREQAARRAEAATIETQTDLDLSGEPEERAAARQEAARARMARIRGDDPEEPEQRQAETETPASRSDLLPDVDEIKSTLRSSRRSSDPAPAAAETADPPPAVKPKRRMRSGFLLVLVLAGLATAAYVYSAPIAAAVPQTEPYLIAYVDWVNETRQTVNATTGPWIEKAQALIESYTGGGEADG